MFFLPNGSGWIRFSPTGLEGFRILLQWSAQRAREDSFFNGSTNGSGEVSVFFQWSAQQVWRGFVFQWSADSFFNGSPNGSGGVLDFFFNGLPNGSGGVSFFNGLPNGPGGIRFSMVRPTGRTWVGSAPAPGTLPGGHFWRDPAPAQVGYITSWTLAIQCWLRGSGLVGGTRLRSLKPPASPASPAPPPATPPASQTMRVADFPNKKSRNFCFENAPATPLASPALHGVLRQHFDCTNYHSDNILGAPQPQK